MEVRELLELLVEASRREEEGEQRLRRQDGPCPESEWTVRPLRAGSSAGQDAHGKALI